MDLIAWPVFERFPALSYINPLFVFGPVERFPFLLKWNRLMLQVPAVQACLVDAESHAHVLRSFPTDTPAYGYGLE